MDSSNCTSKNTQKRARDDAKARYEAEMTEQAPKMLELAEKGTRSGPGNDGARGANEREERGWVRRWQHARGRRERHLQCAVPRRAAHHEARQEDGGEHSKGSIIIIIKKRAP